MGALWDSSNGEKRSAVGSQTLQTFWAAHRHPPAESVPTLMDLDRDMNTIADADEESIIWL